MFGENKRLQTQVRYFGVWLLECGICVAADMMTVTFIECCRLRQWQRTQSASAPWTGTGTALT